MYRSAALLTLLASTAYVEPICAAEPLKREAFDDAIDRGLQYLATNQNRDGSWSVRGSPQPAITALAVMAFLSAGHVPNEGKYGRTVADGIRFVLESQNRNGLFAAREGGGTEMYQHGICTLMTAEALGMTESKDADKLRQRLEDAVAIILRAQVQRGDHHGGWRYTIRSTDSDISVTGWQIMALRAAKNVGCDVPPQAIEAAVAYIQRCRDRSGSGAYCYMVHSHPTVACTGTSILALELCGRNFHRAPELLKAGSYILNRPLSPYQSHFFYGIYYTSQAMFQLGGNYWESYRPKLHELLLKVNPQQANGAWYGRGGDDGQWGPNYCTSMAILALAVEYRFLPIYQRDEDDNKEAKK